MKEFIIKNNLKEITNPVMYDKGYIPTVDGLLSTDIFGVTTKDRKNTYAYISLNGHFLHPFIYKMLKRMNRSFESIVYGTKKFRIEDGKLIEDENGETGLEFLYKNWSKIKFDRNSSRLRNERIDLLEVAHIDEIFIEQWVIIPAFYRDMNLQKRSPGHHKINEYYGKLIRFAMILRNTNNFDFVLESTRGKMQQILEEIYNELKSKIEKKQGLIRRSILGKSIDYGARLVISAPVFSANRYDEMQVDFFNTGVPLATCCVLFTPFVISWVKNYFTRVFEKSQNKFPLLPNKEGATSEDIVYVELRNPELYFNEEYIKKQLDKFINSYADRFEIIEMPIPDDIKKKYGNKFSETIQFRLKGYGKEQDLGSTIFDRELTWCDIFYRACVEIVADKHIYVTRYPILDYFGTYPSKVSVLSTRETMPVYIENTLYKFYPKIDLSLNSEDILVSFIDTLVMSNLYLKGLGGDYDGDMVTIKGVFSQEANAEAHRIMSAKSNILNVYGENIRNTTNEGVHGLYMLTKFESA
jgi:DNA-directed RNA polymerase beta' subunit